MANHPLLIEPHYLPAIPAFRALCHAPSILLDHHYPHRKQTYQNRCYLFHHQGLQKLIIPVRRPANTKPLQEVKIDHTKAWSKQHWQSLSTAYGKTPYWEHFAPLLEPHYLKPPTYLIDFTQPLLATLLSFLHHYPSIDPATNPPSTAQDLRGLFHPKKEPPPAHRQPVTYYHRFGHQPSPQLTALDLLLHQGPHATHLLTHGPPSPRNLP